MALLQIPEKGLTLQSAPPIEIDASKPSSKPIQVMRLDLSQKKVDALIRSIRKEEKTYVLFGKHQTIHFSGQVQNIKAAPETFRHELYHISATDEEQLYFTGKFTHKLEVKKAQDDMADTDASLAALKASLASLEKEKQRKMASEVDIGLTGGKKKGGLPKAKPKHLDLLKGKSQWGQGTTRSMPASPALGASFKPVTSAPTSVPTSARNSKLDALRVPLLHLLAIRPVSEKFLAQQTRSSKEICLEILQKSGREYRLDPSKWELSDRAYKELDVWSFKYPSQEDRQAAIENAISAFDRMRLSSEDKIWQKLHPVTERGKGKTLSRHDFRNGPMAGLNTPRINVQPAEDAGETTGAETDTVRGRLTPNASEPMARSRSQDTFTKKRVSEKEAMSKRLLSKNPLKAQRMAVDKERREKEKKAKRAALKVEGKFKSAEFVEDSDEEDEVETKDAPKETSIEVKPKKADNPPKKKTAPNATKKDDRKTGEKARPEAQARTSNHKKQVSSSSSISSPPTSSDSGKSSTKAERPTIQPPRPRTTSSPTKPSPLGSSPPTNASDFEGGIKNFANSSSSSSPLDSEAKKSTATKSDHTNQEKPQTNGVHTNKTGPTKRKADDFDDSSSNTPLTNGHAAKRHQSTSPSEVTSSGSSSPTSTHQQILEKAQYFKIRWVQYKKLYAEVEGEKKVSEDKLQKLHHMHRRMEELKYELYKAWEGIGVKPSAAEYAST